MSYAHCCCAAISLHLCPPLLFPTSSVMPTSAVWNIIKFMSSLTLVASVVAEFSSLMRHYNTAAYCTYKPNLGSFKARSKVRPKSDLSSTLVRYERLKIQPRSNASILWYIEVFLLVFQNAALSVWGAIYYYYEIGFRSEPCDKYSLYFCAD